MKNFIQPGDSVEITAPAALASGAGVLVGSLFGVAAKDAANGETIVVKTTGVFELPKAAADDVTQGEALNWDDAAGEATVVAADARIGVAIAAAEAGATTVRVRLNGSF